MRTLLANATVITMNPTRDVLDTDILIENGVIADMGPGLAGRPENAGAERVDLSGRIVIPGLIQSHMHVTQSLFRGLADEMELMDWLQRRIWPLEGAHTPETNAAAARLAAAEAELQAVSLNETLVVERLQTDHQFAKSNDFHWLFSFYLQVFMTFCCGASPAQQGFHG